MHNKNKRLNTDSSSDTHTCTSIDRFRLGKVLQIVKVKVDKL